MVDEVATEKRETLIDQHLEKVNTTTFDDSRLDQEFKPLERLKGNTAAWGND